MMDEEQLDAIGVLADAATVDLELEITEHDGMPTTVRVWSPGIGDFVADFWGNRPDADFYFAARTVVPELVAELRACRAALDEAQDLLADKVGQELLDRTMLKGIKTENGQFVMELQPARELLLLWCASVREMLDHHGAENYVENEIGTVVDPDTVSMEIQDGQHNSDAYTLTLQRRYRPTPHELRLRAERERDEALAEVRRLQTKYGEGQSAESSPPDH